MQAGRLFYKSISIEVKAEQAVPVIPNPMNTAMRSFLECQKCGHDLETPAVERFVGCKCPKCYSHSTIIVDRFVL